MVASENYRDEREPQALATIVQGSLTQGLEARLNPGVSVEEMRVGKFVVVRGQRNRFFWIIDRCSSRQHLGTNIN